MFSVEIHQRIYLYLIEINSVLGKVFAPRAYAMAHRNDLDQQTVDQLHAAILEMQEDGSMEALEKKWFIDKGQCWNVTQVSICFKYTQFKLKN